MSMTWNEARKCLKSLMNVLIIKEGDKYRPAKDTSRQDAYRALYEIQEALGTRRLVREELLLENMQGLDLALSALRTPTREMDDELGKYKKFKEYFDDLYGKGLEVENWHMNGETIPFDDFYESACEYAEL